MRVPVLQDVRGVKDVEGAPIPAMDAQVARDTVAVVQAVQPVLQDREEVIRWHAVVALELVLPVAVIARLPVVAVVQVVALPIVVIAKPPVAEAVPVVQGLVLVVLGAPEVVLAVRTARELVREVVQELVQEAVLIVAL